jgi:hypothetical protein
VGSEQPEQGNESECIDITGDTAKAHPLQLIAAICIHASILLASALQHSSPCSDGKPQRRNMVSDCRVNSPCHLASLARQELSHQALWKKPDLLVRA